MIASINQNGDTNLTMQLSAALPPSLRQSLAHISCRAQTTSTNDDAKNLAQQAIYPAACMALSQSHGRGQHERQWHSPEGNLYLSMLLPLKKPIQGSLAIEVALAILCTPYLQPCKALCIKWPNDIGIVTLGQFSKCAGILIEPVSNNLVVIGVGMNMEAINEPALNRLTSSLGQLLPKPPPLFSLAGQVATAIWHATQQFNAAAPSLAQRFNPYDALAGRHLEVRSNPLATGLPMAGIGCGINEDGALCIQQEDTLHTVYSGHIQLL